MPGHGSERKPSSVPFPLAFRSGFVGWSSVWDGRRRPPRAAYPRLSLCLRSGLFGVGHTSPPIWPCSDWGLPCPLAYARGGGLLPHRFTLTLRSLALPRGGLFSVALSVAFRRPGVTWQSTRWSSDFPRGNRFLRDHLVLPAP